MRFASVAFPSSSRNLCHDESIRRWAAGIEAAFFIKGLTARFRVADLLRGKALGELVDPRVHVLRIAFRVRLLCDVRVHLGERGIVGQQQRWRRCRIGVRGSGNGVEITGRRQPSHMSISQR